MGLISHFCAFLTKRQRAGKEHVGAVRL